MNNKTVDTHLDEYFQRINERYAELIDGNEEIISDFRKSKDKEKFKDFIKNNNAAYGELASEIWRMLEHSRFKNKIQLCAVEIMETIKSSIKSYNSNTSKISYSQYIYTSLRDYAFIKKTSGDVENQNDYHITEKLKKKVKYIKKFIEDFQQLHCREVHSSDIKVVAWISKQSGYSENEVKLIIDYLNQSRFSINATGDDDEYAGYEVSDNSEENKELQKQYILLYINKAEELWNKKKEAYIKKRISVLFTWKILNECCVLSEDDLFNLLSDNSHKIIDKRLLKDFMDGKYTDDFSQKRIAKELKISETLATKTIKERFLDILEENLKNQEDLFEE